MTEVFGRCAAEHRHPILAILFLDFSLHLEDTPFGYSVSLILVVSPIDGCEDSAYRIEG